MNQEQLKERTQVFALRIMRLVDAVPFTRSGDVIAKQIARCGTSVGANYRAACKAKSDRDFLNKMVIIEEEADECQYWLGLLKDSDMMKAELIAPLLQEAKELTAIFTASGKTVRDRLRSNGVREDEVAYRTRNLPGEETENTDLQTPDPA